MTHTLPVTGNTETTKPENRAFYPALDGLRAVAFIMVFLHHYYSLPWGWAGVDVFFVLSGFLITGILFDSRDDPHRARNFYVRRTLRIFPLYYGIFLLALLLWPVLRWQWSWAWVAWPLYLGNFLHEVSRSASIPGTPLQMAADGNLTTPCFHGITFYLGHFWSLCVEEQFYLFWPWVVFWVRSRRKLIWLCAIAVIVVPVLRELSPLYLPVWMQRSGQPTYHLMPFQLDGLLLGGMAGLLWRGAHREALLLGSRVLAAAMSAALIVYLANVIYRHPDWHANFPYPSWTLTWGISLINLYSAVVIVSTLRPGGWGYRLLTVFPLRWLGRISYGAYVYHDIFHGLFFDLSLWFATHMVRYHGSRYAVLQQHIRYPFIVVSFTATVLLAWLSFRFFESPFLNLKERWTVRP